MICGFSLPTRGGPKTGVFKTTVFNWSVCGDVPVKTTFKQTQPDHYDDDHHDDDHDDDHHDDHHHDDSHRDDHHHVDDHHDHHQWHWWTKVLTILLTLVNQLIEC